jgi:putative membrane protein
MPSEPPPLPPAPPPLPAQAPPGLTQTLLLEGRLHPLTLVFALWNTLRGIIIPVIIIVAFGRKRAEDYYFLLAMIFLVLPIGLAMIRYFTFTYRIQNGELITHQGVLGRTQRIIPLSRVQDIRLEQSVLHRMFKMADVHVETAGGKEPEASLSVLAMAEAERLRAAVFEAKGAVKSVTEAPPLREVIRQLTLRDLVLAGITSNQMASAIAVLLVAWGLLDDFISPERYERWIVRSTEAVTQWLTQFGRAAWLVFLLATVAAILLGMVFSVIGSVVMFYGFTLARSGEDLHRNYGLFTRRSSSLPRRRIQVLKIEETILRRLFKLATLRADTAASTGPQNQQNTGGRDMLLPIVPKPEVEALLPNFFPDLDEAGEWRQVARVAIRRGTLKGSVACGVLAGALYWVQREWLALWPLVLVPLVYWLNVMSYRYLGYLHGPRYFRTRRGWLRRSTHIVPIRNAQVVVVRQTPFDRRLKVASVLVDTAGKANTGGPPRIENVMQEEALELARALARQAAETRFRI